MTNEQVPLVLFFSEPMPALSSDAFDSSNTRKTGVERETTDDD